MIIPNSLTAVDSSPELAGKEMTFSISTNREMFQTLSANLYSDRQRAVIREYSTNAADAHKLNGNEAMAFDVQLPSILDPNFVVRDYGPGIAPENIASVYIVYGASDKRDSNEFNGMLGLGCKSAFAYADAFMVTSIYAGRKYVYNAFIAENGFPKMLLMSDDETTDPSGVEIRIAIRSEDFQNFRNKAASVYRRFKVRPNIKGQGLSITDIHHAELHGTNWKLRVNQGFNDAEKGAWAVMANVAYPIKLTDNNLTEKQRALLNSNLDIEFETGEVNIAPSREGLTFDARTVANIQKRLNEIGDEISARVAAEFASAKNMWAARLALYSIRSGKWSNFKDILAHLDYVWNGQRVSLTNIRFKHDDVTGTQFAPSTSRRRSGTHRTNLPEDFPTMPNIEFIENDMTKGAWTRCKAIIDSKKAELLYLIDFANPEAKTEFIAALGMEGVVFRKSSELPKVTTYHAHYAASEQGKARVLRLRSVDYKLNGNKDHFAVESVDLAKGGVYIFINRFELSGSPMDKQWFADLKTLGFDMDAQQPVYAFKNAMHSKVVNNPSWITVEQFCKKKIKELLDARDYSQDLARLRAYDAIGDKIKSFFTEYHAVLTPRLLKVADQLVTERDFKHKSSKILDYPIVANRYGVDPLPQVIPSLELAQDIEDALAHYPMVRPLVLTAITHSRNIMQDYNTIIESYLKEIDQKLQNNA